MKRVKHFGLSLMAMLLLTALLWLRTYAGISTKPTDEAYTDQGGSLQETQPAVYTQAVTLANMTPQEVIEAVGPLFTADMQRSGILASVSLAQFLLESGYGKSELIQNANNGFGMKEVLSGNTWSGSTWEAGCIYEKQTQEYIDGGYVTIVSAFRKYNCLEDSIADHSAYLSGVSRYDGLVGETDYRRAITIIKNGGYATDPNYIARICQLIEEYDLTRYDICQTEP